MLLNLSCEVASDIWPVDYDLPSRFYVADSVSPLGYNYFLLPLAAGLVAQRAALAPRWIIIYGGVSCAITVLTGSALSLCTMLNGQREVTLARELCNEGMAGMAILLVVREYRRPMRAGEDTGV